MKIFLTGASSGIGRATAELLAQKGHEVWGTSREAARVPRGANIHPVQLDLTDNASLRPAFANALLDSGGFDVVINNAGSGHFGPAELLPEEALRAQFDLVFFGQVALCQLSLEAMQQRGGGLIINITSLASRLPVPFTAAYNAAKAAMATWTLTTQIELGDSPVRLIDVQPGDTSTEFNDSVRKEGVSHPRYAARVAKTWTVADTNMKHGTKPTEVARQISRLIEHPNPPPRLTIGRPFECVIAPMLYQLLSPRLRVWGFRRYYGI